MYLENLKNLFSSGIVCSMIEMKFSVAHARTSSTYIYLFVEFTLEVLLHMWSQLHTLVQAHECNYLLERVCVHNNKISECQGRTISSLMGEGGGGGWGVVSFYHKLCTICSSPRPFYLYILHHAPFFLIKERIILDVYMFLDMVTHTLFPSPSNF